MHLALESCQLSRGFTSLEKGSRQVCGRSHWLKPLYVLDSQDFTAVASVAKIDRLLESLVRNIGREISRIAIQKGFKVGVWWRRQFLWRLWMPYRLGHWRVRGWAAGSRARWSARSKGCACDTFRIGLYASSTALLSWIANAPQLVMSAIVAGRTSVAHDILHAVGRSRHFITC